MKIKKTIITLAALTMMQQVTFAQEAHFTPTEEENGTKEQPFLIESIEDLNNLAEDIRNGVPKDADDQPTYYNGVYFKLTTDLDYSSVALFDTDEDGTADSNFCPIGFGDESDVPDHHPFMGIFDGDNHTIKGITVNTPDGYGVGLFGYIYYPAVIKNIKMENCSFTANFEVGAIVGGNAGIGDSHIVDGGSSNNSSDSEYGIYNCTVAEDVTVTGVSVTYEGIELSGAMIGGIVGSCSYMTVSDCVSAATVKGDDCVGGITGRLLSSLNSQGIERGILRDCYFRGSVTASSHKGDIAGARGPVADYDGSNGTKGKYIVTLYADDSELDVKNANRIDNYSPQKVDVVFKGVTLKKDGTWNLICLPISVSDITGTPLEGADIRDIESTHFNSETGVLTFNCSQENLGKLNKSNHAYLVKWENGDDITDPVFENFTLFYSPSTTTQTDFADVKGTFTSTAIAASDNTLVCMDADNTFSHPDTDTSVNAFTAYFKLKDDVTSEDVQEYVLNFDEPTGIYNVNADDNVNKSDNAIYDLNGRKVASNLSPITHHLPKGIYIYKGKKIVL